MCYKLFEKLVDVEDINQNGEVDQNVEYDDKEWPRTVDEEEKYFEATEIIESDVQMVEDTEMTKGIDLLEKSSNTFDKDLFIELLGLLYPCLADDIVYCAPELLWYKIKQMTGVDINKVMKIFNEYHKDHIDCKYCCDKKKDLKRKFIQSIYPDSNKRRC